MDGLQEKIARLPAWAREYIKRLEVQANPINSEMCRLQQKVDQMEKRCRVMSDRMAAMTDIFESAARGGNETAQAYVNRVIDEYTVPDEENNDAESKS